MVNQERRLIVPEGQTKIAQRFNAGFRPNGMSPEGTAETRRS